MTQDPDPRTAPDDDEDATTSGVSSNQGVSSEAPAEGADDAPSGNDGSPDRE
ncbi:hypothetical protein [Sphingomonas adhaesiva]|uniref:hypothetical protein n=1 Tax=Sphingomonas adhaesiva TaxID=28212 RepID=UPI002FF8BED7